MSHVTKIHNAALGTKKLPMKSELPKNLFRIASKAVTQCLSLFPGFEDIKNKINK
jgi:UTP-glucose-1-phosphate uridylyltransferase